MASGIAKQIGPFMHSEGAIRKRRVNGIDYIVGIASPIATNRKPQSLYRPYNNAVTPYCHIGAIVVAILAAIVVASFCHVIMTGLRQSIGKGA